MTRDTDGNANGDTEVNMNTTTRMELRPIEQLIPSAKNARTHSEKQIDALRESLREFGFVSPVLIDHHGNVIAGHGRLLAAKLEGFAQVPCVLVEHLTETQRRAYILADNRIAESAGWDYDIVKSELVTLQVNDFDVSITGFDPKGFGLGDTSADHFWGEVKTENSHEYDALIARTRNDVHVKTTDDVYTPDYIYDAVKKFVFDYYGIKTDHILRPFYPGGDYRSEIYTDDCVVIDNPPFSILTEIVKFYMDSNVKFFLFAPALTLFNSSAGCCNCVPVEYDITYDNGVVIPTSFLTNLGEYKIDNCPELYRAIEQAEGEKTREKNKKRPDYEYPDEVVTVNIGKLSKRGLHLKVRPKECRFIRALDEQKKVDKSLFGGGFLLSEKAAAKQAAAEKAAAEKIKWKLSDREMSIVKSLGGVADG